MNNFLKLSQIILPCISTFSFAADFLPKNEIELGKALYQDKNLSLNRNQSCATCHSLTGIGKRKLGLFIDTDNIRNKTFVSKGSIDGKFGTLNAPSVGYAAFSPPFHWDKKEKLYIGGQFWNGRAKELTEQAQMPFLNPDEMAMLSQWAVVTRLKEKYTAAFKKIYQFDLDNIIDYENAPANIQTPNAVTQGYNYLALAITAFEKSSFFNRFNSKYDYYLAGKVPLTELEKQGLALFENEKKGNCAACHPSKPTILKDGSIQPPLFTDFSYDNIGLPRNLLIPNNPKADLGLGGREDIAEKDRQGLEIGKHKVMTLRNIALTAPYGHNGVFKTLKQIVHFYNTRDTLGKVADNTSAGFGKIGWPEPEITQNVNIDELGDLKLTEQEEWAIVAFLKTLTDDYLPIRKPTH